MRPFPDTTETIGVFVDQIDAAQLSPAQIKRAAKLYALVIKETKAAMGFLRAHNPNILSLQYILGTRKVDYRAMEIEGDGWTNDWARKPSDSWRKYWIYTNDGQVPIYRQLDRLREYVADLNNPEWRVYWVNRALELARLSDADGVFADSSHIPTGIPAWLLVDSPLGGQPIQSYIPMLEAWYDHVYPRLKEAGLYFIPNVGSLTTTWDTTTGYYEDCDGIMCENFAVKGSTDDWRLQAERTLQAVSNGKIVIQQTGPDKVTVADGETRLWYLANHLLLKGNRSYVNLMPDNCQLHWLPEYDLQIGKPIRECREISCLVFEDVFYREYEQIAVIVNPRPAGATFPVTNDLGFTECQNYCTLSFSGGGKINPDGTMPSGEVTSEPCGTTIEIPGCGARIVVRKCDWDKGTIWRRDEQEHSKPMSTCDSGYARWDRNITMVKQESVSVGSR